MKNFNAVGWFHERFGLPHQGDKREPHLISKELSDFRLQFLQEELDELREGYEKEDLVKIADALIDLVYVALGTAHFHHLPWEELFDEVQRSNLEKIRADNKSQSRRNSVFDVVKPKEWQPPRIALVLSRYGWPGPLLPFSDEAEPK